MPLARFCAALLGARIGDLWAVLGVTADDLDAVVAKWFRDEVNKAKALFMGGGFGSKMIDKDAPPDQIEQHHRHWFARAAQQRIDDLEAGCFGASEAAGAKEIAAAVVPPLGDAAMPDLSVMVGNLFWVIEQARLRWAESGNPGFWPEMPAGATDGVLKALGIERQVPAVVMLDAGASVPLGKNVAPGRTLREAVDRRILAYTRDSRAADRSIGQTTSELEILVTEFGAERRVRTINRDDLAPVVEALQDILPGWRDDTRLGNGGIVEKARRSRELWSANPTLKPLAPNTVRGHLTTWRQLFRDEGMDPTTLLNFTIRDRRANGGEVDSDFTDGEIEAIFGSALFRGSAAKHRPYDPGDFRTDNWQFWACLIACFTGARIGEIAQLRPSDVTNTIKHGEGVWALRITEEPDEHDDPDEARRLKNSASKRNVPVHDELIRIGLLRLAEDQRLAGAKTLLPNCPKPVRGDFGKQLSKWMSEKFLVRLEIKRKGLGFHGFRHTMTTWLRDAGVPKDARKHIAGRERGDVDDSDDGYGKWKLPTLRHEVMKIAVLDKIRRISARRLRKADAMGSMKRQYRAQGDS